MPPTDDSHPARIAPRAFAAIRARRSFTGDEVAESLLVELLEAARWTGSARNRQPWRWTICRRAGDRCAVADAGSYAAFVADAPVVAVLSIDRQRGGRDAEFDAGRATERLLAAAHFAGLGACPATLAPDRTAALARHLGVPSPWQPGWAIALGPPAPTAKLGPSAVPTGRRALADVVEWR